MNDTIKKQIQKTKNAVFTHSPMNISIKNMGDITFPLSRVAKTTVFNKMFMENSKTIAVYLTFPLCTILKTMVFDRMRKDYLSETMVFDEMRNDNALTPAVVRITYQADALVSIL
ncbi:hypothetical protein H8S77_09500 [Parabacteroides sp. BX2]|jgi:hypothetical protein|uniref:Uncharacterized protein n=1 Tax=Parabacteroides segnis TaxID=2763058 RepID=A0ABR7E0B3_9BACT|nr:MULTISPECIES: hypothetical protein [Parabacteroides]MBC5643118.1 hypothetical protein [Parabacteroides segnis]MCM0714867.1 hypothetical protein [Parabacteroides sp. TA-V-105]